MRSRANVLAVRQRRQHRSAPTAGSLVEVLGPRLVPTPARPEDVARLTVGAMPADGRALADTVGRPAAKDLTAAGIGPAAAAVTVG